MDKNVLRNLSYGMYVVCSKSYKYVGCIANTVVQITSNPMTIAISINHNNYTNEIIKKSNKFSISILSENSNPEIIGTFGYQSSKDIDKFENVDVKELEEMPILTDSCGSIVCKVIQTMETNTHTVFLGEVINMENYSEDKPMTYRYYHEVLKGKSPKNAPTYIEEKEVSIERKIETSKNVWKCNVCGYEADMDELPDDYRCPICGQPKSEFTKITK